MVPVVGLEAFSCPSHRFAKSAFQPHEHWSELRFTISRASEGKR
jgi:hypothetical protein